MRDVFFADLGLTYSDDVSVREDQVERISDYLESRNKANRPPIPEFSQTADDFQQCVIHSEATTIRLIAPAGSGKTQTMINRVLTSVRDGADPKRILMLTFDNSAVDALKSKLEATLGSADEGRGVEGYFDRLQIKTLNAFSYNLLGKYASNLKLQVATEDQRYESFRTVRQDLKARKPELDEMLPSQLLPQYYLDLFSYLKNETFDPRNLQMKELLDCLIDSKVAAAIFEPAQGQPLMARRIMDLAQIVGALFKMYEMELTRRRVMDFDDQKLRLYTKLNEDVKTLSSICQLFSEIIVDEFQDINRLDFELIKLISNDARLVVTGDDDQAIYGFRGCSPEYIIELPRHLGRPVTSFELKVNYRSPANIVRHAESLIKHNVRRIDKNPIPAIEEDATITLIPSLSTTIEAKTVRSLVQESVGSGAEISFRDIAILYRTNAQSLPLQIEFLLQGIPFSVRPEDNVLGNASLSKLLSLLRAKLARKNGSIIGVDDQLNVLNAYYRYISPDTVKWLRKKSSEGVDILDESNLSSISLHFPRIKDGKFYADFNLLLEAEELSDDLDIVSSKFGSGLKGMIGSLEEAMAQEVPLAEVFDMARDFEGDTLGFLEMITIALERGRASRAGNNSNGISLLTYFKSKGRQWHTVILLSCNEGFIPHSLAPVEEERRLFYVAMTRASSDLVVSYVESAVHSRMKPSRFLTESELLPGSSGKDVG